MSEDLQLPADELEAMLQAKTKELIEAKEELIKVRDENKSLVMRSMKVYEENAMLKSSPEISAMKAKMDYQLSMAQRFIAGKAFKVETAEQAYTLIQAGDEMGMTPVQSMQSLYIVNGNIKFWGDKMVARILDAGYSLEYLEETNHSVVVRCFRADGSFDVREKASDTDQVLKRSKAMGFAAKNKLRFHGVRMIASFHLAHLFGSVSDEFTRDFEEHQATLPNSTEAVKDAKADKNLRAFIESATTIDQLVQCYKAAYELDLGDLYDAKFNDLKNENS